MTTDEPWHLNLCYGETIDVLLPAFKPLWLPARAIKYASSPSPAHTRLLVHVTGLPALDQYIDLPATSIALAAGPTAPTKKESRKSPVGQDEDILPIRRPSNDPAVLSRAGPQVEDEEMWDIRAPPKLYGLSRVEREMAVTGKPVHAVDESNPAKTVTSAMTIDDPCEDLLDLDAGFAADAAAASTTTEPINLVVRPKDTSMVAPAAASETKKRLGRPPAALQTDAQAPVAGALETSVSEPSIMPAAAPPAGRKRMGVRRRLPPSSAKDASSGNSPSEEGATITSPESDATTTINHKPTKTTPVSDNAMDIDTPPVARSREGEDRVAEDEEVPSSSTVDSTPFEPDLPKPGSKRRAFAAASAKRSSDEEAKPEDGGVRTKKAKTETGKPVEEPTEMAPVENVEMASDVSAGDVKDGKFLPGDAGSPWEFNLKYGTLLEVFSWTDDKWYPGRSLYYLTTTEPQKTCKLKVHYIGYPKRFDETIDLYPSPDDDPSADGRPLVRIRPPTGGKDVMNPGDVVETDEMWDVKGNLKPHGLTSGMREVGVGGGLIVKRGGGPKR
ncbi:hypothetical protein HDU67_007715 [Dinochytrium kinnereticum]|nr:hypothetical protein HDU67_007715 [Dinochytrium kinnereticum]